MISFAKAGLLALGCSLASIALFAIIVDSRSKPETAVAEVISADPVSPVVEAPTVNTGPALHPLPSSVVAAFASINNYLDVATGSTPSTYGQVQDLGNEEARKIDAALVSLSAAGAVDNSTTVQTCLRMLRKVVAQRVHVARTSVDAKVADGNADRLAPTGIVVNEGSSPPTFVEQMQAKAIEERDAAHEAKSSAANELRLYARDALKFLNQNAARLPEEAAAAAPRLSLLTTAGL